MRVYARRVGYAWAAGTAAVGLLLAAIAATAPLAGAATDPIAGRSTSAAGRPQPATGPVRPATGPVRTVTLVTGDKIGLAGDEQPMITPRERGDDRRSFTTLRRDGDWYVFPSDAIPLVRAGLVDERLFDASALIAQGYHDAATDTVPLLVQHTDAAGAAKARPLAGAPSRRALPRLKLTAHGLRKSTATQFWSKLTAPANVKGKHFRGGVRRVWLNARFQASLEQSAPQVGAPAAWRAGLTGAGVTIAVLDTGYDADHPDLAGRVDAAKDFTGSGDVADRNGHGTHVASIAAGSGAAAGGRRRGVAPGAHLAVGKVLDDEGAGSEDAILAGMQWAVAEAGAKVVNMSLGSRPSDGTDLVSQSVNQLSAQYGALFVVAAGNRGPNAPVDSPASADAALAVASVSKSDKVSAFSSAGPRLGDGAAKPEIAAPGGGIVAARATGTVPDVAGEADYVALSGTSMAAPHVAGAAALMAARHPDWSAAELKASLVASAASVPDAGIHAVGAGRLDVGRALASPLRVSPATLSVDLPASPNETREPRVTYTNDGNEPLTLDLDLAIADRAGKPGPAGLVSLGARSVTVPAHATASVPVRFAGQADAPGWYGGVLVAKAGRHALRTPVAVGQQPRTHLLDVNLLDGNGGSAEGTIFVNNLDDSTVRMYSTDELPLAVPEGRYSIQTAIYTSRPGRDDLLSRVQHPELRVTADTTATLDARWARPIALTVDDRPGASAGIRTIVMGSTTNNGEVISAETIPSDPTFDEIHVGTAPGVSSANFRLANVASLERPLLELSATSPDRFQVRGWWLHQGPAAPYLGSVTLPAVAVPVDAVGTAATTDVAGKLAVLTADDPTGRIEITPVVAALRRAGARMVALAPDGFYWDGADPLAIPTMRVVAESGDRFLAQARAGGLTASVTGHPASPYRYNLGYVQRGSIPTGLAYRTSTARLAAVPTAYHSLTQQGRSLLPSLLDGAESWSTGFSAEVPSPMQRTEYYTPATWRLRLGFRVPADAAVRLDLSPGANPPLSWGRAAIGPALTDAELGNGGRPWAGRERDLIEVRLPLFSDAAGHAELAYTEGIGEETGTTTLHVNGRHLGTVTKAGVGTFTVPAAEGSYRLAATAVLDSPYWPLSTRVCAVWTFRSGTTAAATALPLLAVGIDPPVDVRNTVAVGNTRPVRLSVNRQDGVAARPVTSMRVETSNDDGGTWLAVPVVPDGAAWRAAVPHRAPGYVSLRVRAVDADGNTVEQTIIRAYRIGSVETR